MGSYGIFQLITVYLIFLSKIIKIQRSIVELQLKMSGIFYQTQCKHNVLYIYQSSISIILHLRRLILNHSLSSSMTSVPFPPLLQLHPMILSSPVTLTFISIILQTLSPLSFYLFSLLLILVNMSTSLRTIKITLLI